MLRVILILTLVLSVNGCTDNYFNTTKSEQSNDGGSGTSPSPISKTHPVEFRVTGNVPICHIVVSTTLDGQQVLNTTLPWVQTTSITKDSFLFLSGQSDYVGLIHVQIFVDGVLFREASTDGFGLVSVATASGTFRVDQPAALQFKK